MSAVRNTTGFVIRNRRFIGRTVLWLGVIAAADAAFEKYVVKN